MPLEQSAILCELILSLGCIPVAPYGTPGTPELAKRSSRSCTATTPF